MRCFNWRGQGITGGIYPDLNRQMMEKRPGIFRVVKVLSKIGLFAEMKGIFRVYVEK